GLLRPGGGHEGFPSAGAAPEEHRLRGVEADAKVEEERLVERVVEVVLELVLRVVDGRAVRIADLRPPGDARLHRLAKAEERDLGLELVDEEGALGTRADEAHVAAEDGEDLRDLVEAGLAQEGPDPGDARILLRRPHGTGQRLR